MTIEGFVRFEDGQDLVNIDGVVRLEDVSEIDARSHTLAQAALAADSGRAPIAFRLVVEPEPAPRGNYIVSVEAWATRSSTGERHPFGTVAAHPWKARADGAPMIIDVRAWS